MNLTASIISSFQARKGKLPLAQITAYDYPTARLVDEAGYDIILVGDSLGMVVMGMPDTTEVTMAHMLHHVAMVARGVQRALIVADMPIHSYDTPEQALENARALIAAGAHAVKLEGGLDVEAQITALSAAGIPVQAHIGLLPQRVKEEGGYRIKGKSAEEAAQLMRDMQAVVRAGAFSTVIECTKPQTALSLTRACPIPTIGIGSGDKSCDGQVTVFHDLVGAYPWFVPSFVQPRAQISQDIQRALTEWRNALQLPDEI